MRARGLALALVVVAVQGCGAARAATPTATLPPDSVELLRRALERARPGFPTQADALRSGVYQPDDVAAAPREERAVRPVAPAPPADPGSAPPRPTPPPAPADRPSPPRPDPPGSAPARFGIQIAAFRDAASADFAAREARRTFPDLTVTATAADGWFRVIVAGWARESDAAAALPAVRARYPSAWVRALPLP